MYLQRLLSVIGCGMRLLVCDINKEKTDYLRIKSILFDITEPEL